MSASFAPLTRAGSPFRISAVLFDFDGTLTRPDLIDFAAIRRAVDCPSGTGLLEYLEDIDDVEQRRHYEVILERAEMEAADRAVPNSGAVDLIAFLRERRIPLAIITRNREAMVERSLRRMEGIDPSDFQLVVSRDLPMGPKPSPEGVFHASETLGVDVSRLLVVGDHLFDVEAGRRAGALTMLVGNGSLKPEDEGEADFVVKDLAEAKRVVGYGLPLRVGKLPAEYLSDGLAEIVLDDPTVLVGAGIGEDAAALDIAADEVLVVASDPITLAMDSIARYAVLANANDVATSGATPRWLLTTLMFPPGATASEIVALVKDIHGICDAWGISLCGGHTEITDAVSRPLVVGMMAGTAPAGGLFDKSAMRSGDRILLSKGVAIEGTGLIAREFSARLAAGGMSEAEIERCASFLEEISILEEARACRGHQGVSALHDVTEGGLASAIAELGTAGGCRLRINMEAIPVYPETARVCEVLGLDPLGLIGSGSLLIVCGPSSVAGLSAELERHGIAATDIGEVVGPGTGVEAYQAGQSVEWPVFERDEVSRLLR